MANIKKIYNNVGEQIYAQTHEKAVVDNNGTTAETKFGLLQEAYSALTQSDIVVVADHTAVVSPVANTIYREQGTTSYTDWMYYDSSWKKMAEYDNAIDDVPIEGSNNLVKSGGIARGILIEDADNADESVVIQSDFGVEEYAKIDANGVKAKAFLDKDGRIINELVDSVMDKTCGITHETLDDNAEEYVSFTSEFGIEEYARIDSDGLSAKKLKAPIILDGNDNDVLASFNDMKSKTDNIGYEKEDNNTEEFVLFTSDFGANEWAKIDNSGIRVKDFGYLTPSYYNVNGYISGKIEKIRNLFYSGGVVDAFAFFTDAHYIYNMNNKTAQLLGYILKETNVNKVVFGGDICSVDTGRDRLFEEINAYKKIVNSVKNDCNFYSVHGNHDYYERWSESGQQVSHILPNSSYYNDIFAQSNKDIVKDTNNSIGCYYYFDNIASNLRYIILDTSYNGANTTFGSTQLSWVASILYETPNNLDIVFIQHIGFSNGVDPSTTELASLTNELELINAFNGRSTWTYNSISYNFSGKTNYIIAEINGHTHQDQQTYRNGVAYISTACSAATEDIRKSPMAGVVSPPSKYFNTINEDCIDVYVINRANSVIDIVRIGAGFDRKFNLTPITIQVGSTYTLTSTLDDVISWVVNDSTGATFSSTAGQDGEYWSFTHNIASINDSGVVTALAAGDCYAVAISINGDKEFFYIKVNN